MYTTCHAHLKSSHFFQHYAKTTRPGGKKIHPIFIVILCTCGAINHVIASITKKIHL